ncbi:hypothetical protein EMIHUDRAFT_459621 [Emiliania huxleyi CCMP1516]|uniref:PH domain-containing protein n=2 Tax=Emiliania huxleyi TaxID=2903 RepID=A0A0D3IP11_EMIH1|nr:hypothetical protein EMIHUDRAFT_459621 [Emiliania huxleyi CCMP1516]EOD12996.1 hypothetical protein EMIHUDRAFT_459621 [Emiliania huxleyi CCMP1516]|eukprot:XP_005765425.1 hypothetical protein EMIHUDRAFT_459621 [Emiliania huxleyi CCMP1516]
MGLFATAAGGKIAISTAGEARAQEWLKSVDGPSGSCFEPAAAAAAASDGFATAAAAVAATPVACGAIGAAPPPVYAMHRPSGPGAFKRPRRSVGAPSAAQAGAAAAAAAPSAASSTVPMAPAQAGGGELGAAQSHRRPLAPTDASLRAARPGHRPPTTANSAPRAGGFRAPRQLPKPAAGRTAAGAELTSGHQLTSGNHAEPHHAKPRVESAPAGAAGSWTTRARRRCCTRRAAGTPAAATCEVRGRQSRRAGAAEACGKTLSPREEKVRERRDV